MAERPPTFEELLAKDRSEMLRTMAPIMAAEQGTPVENIDFDTDLQDLAWSFEDPAITPEHLAAVEQMARQEAMQQQLAPEDAESLVREKRSEARWPYRSLVWSFGVLDEEDGIKRAEQVAKRVAARQPSPIETAASYGQAGRTFPVDAEMIEMPMPAQQQAAPEGMY